MKLIVGIDPGLNTGVACINIDNSTITTHTLRNASIGDVCEYLLSCGEPIIVASDVKRVPRAVKKISAAFNARLFYSQLSVNEKIQLAKNFDYSNVHERDALAAATSAWKFFRPTFAKVDIALERKGLMHLASAVKEMLVKRRAGNIESALKMLIPIAEPEKKKIKIKAIKKPDFIFSKGRIASFESKLQEKDQEIDELRKDIAILRNRNRDKTIENLRKATDELRADVGEKWKQLETMKRLLAEGYEIIVPFRDGEDVRDKVVLVEKNLRMLGKAKPRAIIADDYFPANAPVIPRSSIEIIPVGNILVAEKKKLEELIEKESFLQYLEKYKHRYEKTEKHQAKAETWK